MLSEILRAMAILYSRAFRLPPFINRHEDEVLLLSHEGMR